MNPLPTLLLAFCLCLTAQAQSVTLAWDPSPFPLIDYVVNYNDGLREHQSPVTSLCEITISNLIGGTTNIFTVTAFNVAGNQSPPSVPVTYLVPDTTVSVYLAKSLTGPRSLLDTRADNLFNLIDYATNVGYYFASNSTGWIVNTNGGMPVNYAPPMPVLGPPFNLLTK
jgi:hypothetical protein